MSKGCKVTIHQTLRMIQIWVERTRTHSVLMAEGADFFLRAPTLTASNF